ncbi:magnesium-translocating P-type ATPase, partial [Plesiomonas shigelloides]|nr:magnesium-translocating P-type ATPase [Plesiomonas shigelloides]
GRRSQLRAGETSHLACPIGGVVPGDMLTLSAGDMIPADVRLLSAKDLCVSQAALTGESRPVEKHADRLDSAERDPLQQPSLSFMGTNVVSGTAIAMVIATGQQTYFGSMAERVIRQDDTANAFQTGISKVSWLLIRFMLVMTPIVLLLNGF